MKRKHTIFVVPHERARFQRFALSTRQAFLLALCFLGVATFAVFSTWSFVSGRVSASELARLRAENLALREVNKGYESSLRDLGARLEEYRDRTESLAIVAGLEPADSEGGIGGESGDGGDSNRADALAEAAMALEARLDQVEVELDDRARRISTTPSVAPARGLLTSRYGYRTDPMTGKRTLHRGIDIGTKPNRPVIASADGVVTSAGRDGALGTAITLSHGFGLVTRYGHLSSAAVAPGAHVSQGDVIGYVGRSGRATGYHLHYEVRLDGRPVDPLQYVLDGISGP